MRLAEIEIISGEYHTITSDSKMVDELPARFSKLRGLLKPAFKIDNYDVVVSIQHKKRDYFIVAYGKPIGLAQIDPYWIDFIDGRTTHYIPSLFILPDYRRQRIAKRFYEHLIEGGMIIMANQQTIDAKNLWKSFLGQFRLLRWDENKNYEWKSIPVTNIVEFDAAYDDRFTKLSVDKG